MNCLKMSVVVGVLIFVACEPQSPITVTIIDYGQVHRLITNERLPSSLFVQAGIILGVSDRALLNGYEIKIDQPLPPSKSYTIQIRRAITLTINGKNIQSTALKVGEALSQAGIPVYAQDMLEPPADAPIIKGMAIEDVPSKEFKITTEGKQFLIRSASHTVGDVLAEGGFPLLGLDISHPSENEPIPQDGQIRIVDVSEAVVLAQTSIPFKSSFQASSDVELDHQAILQPGQLGLAVSRTRIRYENGKEVSRHTESQTVVRDPVDRIVGYGTKVVVHTATIDGVQIKYWRAVQMFTTAYSPCNSGGNQCYSGTSSGKPVQKGVTAVRYSWYLNMQGQALFIPGYGFATIEDVCGGCVGKPWIDLGYTDAQFQQEGGQWGKYVTVYFLAPPPPNVLFILQ